MATYTDLQNALRNSLLTDRVEIAIAVAAVAISTELGSVTNHANRLIWAQEALGNLGGMAARFLPAVLAKNKNASIATITAASDAAIQTQVDELVDLFAQG